MASYENWSHAIAAYCTAGAPTGSAIFLSIDGDAIGEVAAGFMEESLSDSPERDFLSAVRRQVVEPYGDSVCVSGLRGSSDGVPSGVAFLALMVFAAYNMQEEEGIDEANYFLRLREALGMPTLQGRPVGMATGAEEPLWMAWNHYLAHAGFQATAERGSGPQTYLRYALSQAILREADRQYLRQ